MFPIKDDNPAVHPPILTVALIVVNVLVFGWQMLGDPLERERKVFEYATVPYNVTHRETEAVSVIRVDRRRGGAVREMVAVERGSARPDELVFVQRIPAWATLVTAMFMHGGLMHILGNLVFLWVFGNNIEDALGRVRFLAFYLLTGLAATAAHIVADPDGVIPTLGASGAISGILGGYVLLYPKARVLALLPLGFVLFTRYVPAVLFLGIWFVMQISGLFGGGGGVAWWAHIGGFVAGLALVKVFETREHRERPRVERAHAPFDLQPRGRGARRW